MMTTLCMDRDEPAARTIRAGGFDRKHFVIRIDGADHILHSWSLNPECLETEWMRLDEYKRSCRVSVLYVLRRGGIRATVRLLRGRFKHRRLDYTRL